MALWINSRNAVSILNVEVGGWGVALGISWGTTGGGGGGGILEDRRPGGGVGVRGWGGSCAAQMEPHRETMQPISSPTSLPTAASVGRSSTAQYINWLKLREGCGGGRRRCWERNQWASYRSVHTASWITLCVCVWTHLLLETLLMIHSFYLKGTVHINKHANVTMPELAKGYCSTAAPGSSEEEITMQWQTNKKKSKNN